MTSAHTENGFETVNSVSKEPIMNGPSTVPLANHVPSVNHVSNNISQDKMDKSKEHKSHHSSSSKHGEHKHSDHKHHSSSSSKHKSSSDSSKHKHHSSSSKDRHHHSKHKDGSSSSSSQKHKDGSSSSSSHRHKDGSSGSSSHKQKDGSSSSSHKHKDGTSSSSSHKHGSGSSSSHKHKDGSSSSSHKHKDGSSSSPHKSKDGRPKEHSSSHSSTNKEQSQRMDGQSSLSSSNKSEVHSSSKHKSESSPTKMPAVPPLTIKVKAESVSPVKVKSETVSPPKHNSDLLHFKKLKKERVSDDDDDVPLSVRKGMKVKSEPKMEIIEKAAKRPAEDSDDEPLSARVENVKKIKKEQVPNKKRKSMDDEYAPKKKKTKPNKAVKVESSPKKGKGKKGKKAEDTSTVWKWWEEEKKTDGSKWSTLTHNGPVFAPPYEPLPDSVKFYYDGKEMKLSSDAEEVATFYGKMLEHDYTTKDIFNKNFFKDWRKTMKEKERGIITNLSKCNFKPICEYFKIKTEERKNWTKDQKNKLKEENARLVEEYGFCIIDGHKQKIGNFRIEPPGLFRGRGDHPKQGMHKKRTMPEDVIINCAKGSDIPQAPDGHRWKEVRHDNQVTWLSSWNENIQGSTKYVMLNAASKLKGEKDWQKYETARKLHGIVDQIRLNYRNDFKSKEMRIRQRAAALYFIDKLALRAGNEKDEDQADTVGCCSLRTEHIKLHEEYEGEPYVVEFDFLGKDSIRYYNRVSIDKRVFRNLQLFQENKAPGDDLFDRLNTAILNKHLQSLMDGLTAKVFRTYNASKTLQEQLDKLTVEDDPIPAKLLSYNRANRAVAVLCNHQRAAPKNFSQQMERLQEKIDAKKDAVKQAKKDVKDAKVDVKQLKTDGAKKLLERKKKAVERLEDQLTKLEVQLTDKDENKEIALGTSKLNYLDPRISVAWCKKWDVPVEKVYNKTQREKFAWAIEMVDEDYKFFDQDE